MDNMSRESVLLALAEVVQDIDVIELICKRAGHFDDESELDALEKRVIQAVSSHRVHNAWPPEVVMCGDVAKL